MSEPVTRPMLLEMIKYQLWNNVEAANVSEITVFDHLFERAAIDRDVLDLSGWNMSNALSMDSMFSNTVASTIEISSWDVSSVLNMDYLFYCSAFDYDISKWEPMALQSYSNMVDTEVLEDYKTSEEKFELVIADAPGWRRWRNMQKLEEL